MSTNFYIKTGLSSVELDFLNNFQHRQQTPPKNAANPEGRRIEIGQGHRRTGLLEARSTVEAYEIDPLSRDRTFANMRDATCLTENWLTRARFDVSGMTLDFAGELQALVASLDADPDEPHMHAVTTAVDALVTAEKKFLLLERSAEKHHRDSISEFNALCQIQGAHPTIQQVHDALNASRRATHALREAAEAAKSMAYRAEICRMVINNALNSGDHPNKLSLLTLFLSELEAISIRCANWHLRHTQKSNLQMHYSITTQNLDYELLINGHRDR